MIEGHGDDLYKYGKKIVSNFSSNVYNRIDHSGLYQRLNELYHLQLSRADALFFGK
jgi:threonine-phosphate decarboxylase